MNSGSCSQISSSCNCPICVLDRKVRGPAIYSVDATVNGGRGVGLNVEVTGREFWHPGRY